MMRTKFDGPLWARYQLKTDLQNVPVFAVTTFGNETADRLTTHHEVSINRFAGTVVTSQALIIEGVPPTTPSMEEFMKVYNQFSEEDKATYQKLQHKCTVAIAQSDLGIIKRPLAEDATGNPDLWPANIHAAFMKAFYMEVPSAPESIRNDAPGEAGPRANGSLGAASIGATSNSEAAHISHRDAVAKDALNHHTLYEKMPFTAVMKSIPHTAEPIKSLLVNIKNARRLYEKDPKAVEQGLDTAVSDMATACERIPGHFKGSIRFSFFDFVSRLAPYSDKHSRVNPKCPPVLYGLKQSLLDLVYLRTSNHLHFYEARPLEFAKRFVALVMYAGVELVPRDMTQMSQQESKEAVYRGSIADDVAAQLMGDSENYLLTPTEFAGALQIFGSMASAAIEHAKSAPAVHAAYEVTAAQPVPAPSTTTAPDCAAINAEMEKQLSSLATQKKVNALEKKTEALSKSLEQQSMALERQSNALEQQHVLLQQTFELLRAQKADPEPATTPAAPPATAGGGKAAPSPPAGGKKPHKA